MTYNDISDGLSKSTQGDYLMMTRQMKDARLIDRMTRTTVKAYDAKDWYGFFNVASLLERGNDIGPVSGDEIARIREEAA